MSAYPKVVKIYGNRVWCESDIIGNKHVFVQSEAPGAEPFTWCTLYYDYRHTNNATQRRCAEEVAKMLGASDPVEWRSRAFNIGGDDEA